MPQPFSRTLRSLKADSQVSTLIWIAVALILLLAWTSWFFFARITRYEDSNILSAAGRGAIEAEFPQEALRAIRPGQPVFVTLLTHASANMADAETETLEALVAKIPSRHGDRPGIIRIFLKEQPSVPLVPGKTVDGKAAVATETISPFTLVMQASGVFTEAAKIRLSPRRSSLQERER